MSTSPDNPSTNPSGNPAAIPVGRIHVGLDDLPETTDVLVIGLGVTGAGVALDAVTRGLDVVAVDAHDVAFGTSRWSSKLVHGGLRYLAKGQLDVAHESAVERGILMETTAPHLVRALPMLLPLTPAISRTQAFLARSGIGAGDLLRLFARTRRETLPRPRRIGVTETLTLAPVIRQQGLARSDPVLGRPARGRRPPGAGDRPHGGGPRRPGAHPGQGQRGHREQRHADRCPHRRHPHDHRPHGDQRRRCLGGRRRPRDPAAPQSRQPPGAAQGDPAGRALRDHGAGARRQQPLRLRAAPTRPDLLRRPDRRGGGRRDPRRPRGARGGPRLPAGRDQQRPAARRTPQRHRRDVRRAAAPARHRRQHRRPVPQARGPGLGDGRGDRRGRQADHLPADGPGRRGPRRRRQRAGGRTLPDQTAAAGRCGAPRRARPSWSHRPGWCGASAPRPLRSCRTRSR